MKKRTQLWAMPIPGTKVNGKHAQPYRLHNTKSVCGLAAWMEHLKFVHGATFAGIEKRTESGETISFHPAK